MDPRFAPAYAALADIHVLEGHLYAEPAAALAAASVAAMKALELDEQLAAAHTSAGYVAQFGHWDWETAEREYRRAIALDPNSAQARRRYWALLSMQGRFYEAEQEILVARVLDPLSPLATTNLAQHLGWVGRRAEALALLRQTLSETPGFGPAHYARWLLYQADGAGQEDRVLVAELTATLRGFGFVDVAAGLEPVAAANGYQEAARWAARELARLSDRQRVSPTLIAELFMVSDDADEALRWLQRGYAQRSPEIAWIAVEPQWRPLHEREGFQALVRALRLALVPLRS
jgi:tetratricopeptide (TPR) repeat protein